MRRIGSGRILTRDMWDFRGENEKLDSERSDYNFRPGAGGGGPLRDRDNRDNREAGRERERDNIRERDERIDERRYERRSFGRDFGDRDRNDRDRGLDRNERGQVERDKDRGRDRRYGNDRRRGYNENREIEEPEWFSSGPTSQHDTIELRGFEDTPEEKAMASNARGKKQSPAQKKRGKKSVAEKDDKVSENTAGPRGRSTPTSMDQSIHVAVAPHSPISERNEPVSLPSKAKSDPKQNKLKDQNSEPDISNVTQKTNPPGFNLDDFLKSDTFPGVPGLLTVS